MTSTPAEQDSEDLAELFVEVTGETTVTESQEGEGDESVRDSDEFEEYQDRYEELSRHDALEDAIAEPEEQE